MFFLAAALPVLFWTGAPNTAPTLQQAGIDHIAVPAFQADPWKNVSGISVESADLDKTVKLPSPGVQLHMSQASASRVPWVNSNGWRFMRQPSARFSYDVKGNTAALAAAEAFCFGANAVIQSDASGLASLSSMLKFLSTLEGRPGPALTDVGFVDNGSSTDAEVMNLMVRDNLLFSIVRTPNPNLTLNVQIGSKEYPTQEATNPDTMEHKIRANLGDARRLVRIYGASVVVVHVTGEQGKVRLHLLNYGSGQGTRVGAFRVRILGHYSKGQLHSFDDTNDQLADYSP